MSPGGRKGLGGDPQFHPPEVTGGERDQQVVGQGETLSLVQLFDFSLKTVQASTAGIGF
jgi:hypothetical protein